MENNKICRECNELKPINDFYFHKFTGYYSRKCKNCTNKDRRLNYPILSGRRDNSIYIRQKTCTKCNITKDLNIANFTKFGGNFSKVCRDCSDIVKNENLEKKIAKGHLSDTNVKECIICKELKTISNFSYSKKYKYYSSYCKPCDVKRKQNRILNMTTEEKENIKKYRRNWHKLNKEKSSLIKYRGFDFNNSLENDLTLDYLINQLKKCCVYCGYPSTGLDRIDNIKGHTQSNCVPCCWECNTARMNNFSYEEMKIIGKSIKQVKDSRQNLI